MQARKGDGKSHRQAGGDPQRSGAKKRPETSFYLFIYLKLFFPTKFLFKIVGKNKSAHSSAENGSLKMKKCLVFRPRMSIYLLEKTSHIWGLHFKGRNEKISIYALK